MTSSKKNPKVDEFLNNEKWGEELKILRTILLEFDVTEEFKWGKPCYMYKDDNIAILQGFKNYCAILFVKGSLLKDPKGILIQQTENVQAARQLRFKSLEEIENIENTINEYINEAIEIEKMGLEVEFKKTDEFKVPVEFQNKMEEMPALKDAFRALTPGRQKSYLLYFGDAKQSKTREARIEKYIDKILDGLGLND